MLVSFGDDASDDPEVMVNSENEDNNEDGSTGSGKTKTDSGGDSDDEKGNCWSFHVSCCEFTLDFNASINKGAEEQSIATKLSALSAQKADKSCLRGFLPQLIPTLNLGHEIKTMFKDSKNALKGLQGEIRVTRKQRELLVRSQREWENGAVALSRLQNHAVLSWPIHASAFYDCLRLFPIDMCGIGFGTSEIGAQISFKGLSFKYFDLPKADGTPSPTRKYFFDKIYRALQRKAAAVAAIERQKERARLAKEQAEREAREELERQRRSMDPQVRSSFYRMILSRLIMGTFFFNRSFMMKRKIHSS